GSNRTSRSSTIPRRSRRAKTHNSRRRFASCSTSSTGAHPRPFPGRREPPRRRLSSNPSYEQQAEVVLGWPTATELSDPRENAFCKVHDGSRVPCPQHLLDARLPELFVVAVSRLDESVREDGEKVAMLEREAPDVTAPVLEKAERRRRR